MEWGSVDGKHLEKVARQFRSELLTPSEVVYYCFREAENLELGDGAQAIRDSVSPELFKHLQEAAIRALETMLPEADHIGVGFVTPEAPPLTTEIPRSFLVSMASGEEPA